MHYNIDPTLQPETGKRNKQNGTQKKKDDAHEAKCQGCKRCRNATEASKAAPIEDMQYTTSPLHLVLTDVETSHKQICRGGSAAVTVRQIVGRTFRIKM